VAAFDAFASRERGVRVDGQERTILRNLEMVVDATTQQMDTVDGALQRLVREGLVRVRGQRPRVYEITRKGRQAA
jgi:DNA-binding PadR family transcriptional regulator